VRRVLVDAARRGARTLVACDADFAGWPLDDARVLDALTRWAAPGRRLTLFALHYDAFVSLHPRWTAWRRTWSHLVDTRAAAEAGELPTLLLARGDGHACTLRLVDAKRWRGTLSLRAEDAARARDQIDAISQRSVPAFAPTTLGL